MTTERKTKAKVTETRPGALLPHLVDLENVPDDGPLFEDTDVPVQYLFKYLD